MKYFVIIFASLFVAGQAQAVDLTCTVPAANVTRSIELCEELRLELKVRSAEWSNDICVTAFLRMGMLNGEVVSSTRTAEASVADSVGLAVNAFASTWQNPPKAACGDGTLDTEFGEACDDGNLADGDGCDGTCAVE